MKNKTDFELYSDESQMKWEKKWLQPTEFTWIKITNDK